MINPRIIMQSMQSEHAALLLTLIAVVFVITIFYCLTLFRFLQRIPKEQHHFPSWFVWLFLVPWVGFVFQWIMLPFGIPKTIKTAFSRNQDIIAKADTLFKVGLAQVILATLNIIVHISPFHQIMSIIGIVLWIIYWVKIVKLNREI